MSSNLSDTPKDARHERRGPSRGFWIGMTGVLMFALLLTAVGFVGANWNVETAAVPAGSQTPVPTVRIEPRTRPTTPPDNVALELDY